MRTDQVPAATASDGAPPAARLNVRGGPMIVIAGATAVYVVREAAALLIPIFLSLLLAYALEPLLTAFIRLRVPRLVAAALVFLALSITAGAATRAVRAQASSFIDDLPRIAGSVGDAIRDRTRRAGSPGPLARVERAAREVDKAVTGAAAHPAPNVVAVTPTRKRFAIDDYLADATRSAARLGAHGLVIVLLTFLLAATGDRYKWKVVEFAGPRRWRQRVTLDILRTIDRQIQRYLLARLAISLIVAFATAVGLVWLGVAHALVWGAIAGALNVLPFVGPIVAVAVIALAAFVQFHSVTVTAAACGIAGGVAALEGNLITPWLTSRAGELNNVSVFVSVMFWGWMWGTWGLLLAIPIVVAVKAAADHVEALQPLAELLGQ